MKRSIRTPRLAVWVIALCLTAFFADALAGERGERKKPKQPRKPTVVGVVATEKKDDEIKSVTLTAKRKGKEAVYNVTLDEKGKRLGEEMDGKKVVARGTISEKDGKKWITVERYREAKPRKKKPSREE